MRRGVAQPIPPPPLPFCWAVCLVVMLWVDAVVGLAPVCEFLVPGGRPGPRVGWRFSCSNLVLGLGLGLGPGRALGLALSLGRLPS